MTDLPENQARAQDKEEAQGFLLGFEKSLKKSLPHAPEMELEIRKTVAAAKTQYSERHLRLPEAAFLNKFVVPALAEMIGAYAKLDIESTRKALLAEYHPCMSSISCGSPWHSLKHPFTKLLNAKAESIYLRWMDPKKAVVQSCPDFALRQPFPHKILFEGKYFPNGSLPYAKRVLVNDIYQAFFYRGLPFAEGTKSGRAGWEYDYACLLAYDASPGGTLRNAWESLPQGVRNSFWKGANIYVMILGGQGRQKK